MAFTVPTPEGSGAPSETNVEKLNVKPVTQPTTTTPTTPVQDPLDQVDVSDTHQKSNDPLDNLQVSDKSADPLDNVSADANTKIPKITSAQQSFQLDKLPAGGYQAVPPEGWEPTTDFSSLNFNVNPDLLRTYNIRADQAEKMLAKGKIVPFSSMDEGHKNILQAKIASDATVENPHQNMTVPNPTAPVKDIMDNLKKSDEDFYSNLTTNKESKQTILDTEPVKLPIGYEAGKGDKNLVAGQRYAIGGTTGEGNVPGVKVWTGDHFEPIPLQKPSVLSRTLQEFKGMDSIPAEQLSSRLQDIRNDNKYDILQQSGYVSPINPKLPKDIQSFLKSDEYLNSSPDDKKMYAKELFMAHKDELVGIVPNDFYESIKDTFTPSLNSIFIRQGAKDNIGLASQTLNSLPTKQDPHSGLKYPDVDNPTYGIAKKAIDNYQRIIDDDPVNGEATKIANSLRQNIGGLDPILNPILDVSDAIDLHKVVNKVKSQGEQSLTAPEKILYDSQALLNSYQQVSHPDVLTQAIGSIPSAVGFILSLGGTKELSVASTKVLTGYLSRGLQKATPEMVANFAETIRAIKDIAPSVGKITDYSVGLASKIASGTADITAQTLLARNQQVLSGALDDISGNPNSQFSYEHSVKTTQLNTPDKDGLPQSLLKRFLIESVNIGAFKVAGKITDLQNMALLRFLDKNPAADKWLNYLYTQNAYESLLKQGIKIDNPISIGSLIRKLDVPSVPAEFAAIGVMSPRITSLIRGDHSDELMSNFPAQIKKDLIGFSGLALVSGLGRLTSIAQGIWISKVTYANEFRLMDFTDKVYSPSNLEFADPNYQSKLNKIWQPLALSSSRKNNTAAQLMQAHMLIRSNFDAGEIYGLKESIKDAKTYMEECATAQTLMNKITDGIKDGTVHKTEIQDAIKNAPDEGWKEQYQLYLDLVNQYSLSATTETLKEFVDKYKAEYQSIKDDLLVSDKLKTQPNWLEYSKRIDALPLPTTYKLECRSILDNVYDKWKEQNDKYIIQTDKKIAPNQFRNGADTFMLEPNGKYKLITSNPDEFLTNLTTSISKMNNENIGILMDIVNNSDVNSQQKSKINDAIKERLLRSFKDAEFLTDIGGNKNFIDLISMANTLQLLAPFTPEEKQALTTSVGHILSNEIKKEFSKDNLDNVKSVLQTCMQYLNVFKPSDIMDLTKFIYATSTKSILENSSNNQVIELASEGDKLAIEELDFRKRNDFLQEEEKKLALEMLKGKNIVVGKDFVTLKNSNKYVKRLDEKLQELVAQGRIDENERFVLQGIVSLQPIEHFRFNRIELQKTDNESAASYYNPVSKGLVIQYTDKTPSWKIVGEIAHEINHSVHDNLTSGLAQGGIGNGNFVMDDRTISEITSSNRADVVANIARWYRGKDYDYTNYLRLQKLGTLRNSSERLEYDGIVSMLDWYRNHFNQLDRNNMSFADDINKDLKWNFTTELLVKNYNRWSELRKSGYKPASAHYFSAYAHEYVAEVFSNRNVTLATNQLAGEEPMLKLYNSMSDWTSKNLKVPLLQRLYKSTIFEEIGAKKFLNQLISIRDIDNMMKVTVTPDECINENTKNEFDNIADKTIGTLRTSNFNDWFDESKIVDDKGNPLVVYHGTNAEFHIFDKKKQGSNTEAPNTVFGHFFIADKKLAEDFTKENGGGDKIIPAYLSIKNPVYLTLNGIFTNEKQAPVLAKIIFGKNLSPKSALNLINKEIGMGEIDELGDVLETKEAKNAFVKAGFDGIISDFGAGHKEYIAFESNQIKHATLNSGKYDKNNPSIIGSYRDDESLPELREQYRKIVEQGNPQLIEDMYAHILSTIKELGYDDSIVNDLIGQLNKDASLIVPANIEPVVVRHMDTDEVDEELSDSPGEPLNDIGKLDAEKLGEEFKEKKITKILTPSTKRNRQTAKIAGKIAKAKVEVVDTLKTLDTGIYTGLPESEFDEAHYVNNPDTKIPDGESFNDFLKRSIEAKQIKDNADNKTAIIANSKMMAVWDALDANAQIWNDEAKKMYLERDVNKSEVSIGQKESELSPEKKEMIAEVNKKGKRGDLIPNAEDSSVTVLNANEVSEKKVDGTESNKCETNVFNFIKNQEGNRYFPVGGYLINNNNTPIEHWWVYDSKTGKQFDITPNEEAMPADYKKGYVGIIEKGLNDEIKAAKYFHDIDFFKGGNVQSMYFDKIKPAEIETKKDKLLESNPEAPNYVDGFRNFEDFLNRNHEADKIQRIGMYAGLKGLNNLLDTDPALYKTLRKNFDMWNKIGSTNSMENFLKYGFFMETLGKKFPKFEISDKDMRLDRNLLQEAYDVTSELSHEKAGGKSQTFNTTLGDLITHSKLFNIYPQLKYTRLTFYNDPERNEYGIADRGVGINLAHSQKDDFELEALLIHEMQHKAQEYEGWWAGGNPEMFQKKLFLYNTYILYKSGDPVIKKIVNSNDYHEVRTALGDISNGTHINMNDEMFLDTKHMELVNHVTSTPEYKFAFKLYESLIGEREATDAANRYLLPSLYRMQEPVTMALSMKPRQQAIPLIGSFRPEANVHPVDTAWYMDLFKDKNGVVSKDNVLKLINDIHENFYTYGQSTKIAKELASKHARDIIDMWKERLIQTSTPKISKYDKQELLRLLVTPVRKNILEYEKDINFISSVITDANYRHAFDIAKVQQRLAKNRLMRKNKDNVNFYIAVRKLTSINLRMFDTPESLAEFTSLVSSKIENINVKDFIDKSNKLYDEYVDWKKQFNDQYKTNSDTTVKDTTPLEDAMMEMRRDLAKQAIHNMTNFGESMVDKKYIDEFANIDIDGLDNKEFASNSQATGYEDILHQLLNNPESVDHKLIQFVDKIKARDWYEKANQELSQKYIDLLNDKSMPSSVMDILTDNITGMIPGIQFPKLERKGLKVKITGWHDKLGNISAHSLSVLFDALEGFPKAQVGLLNSEIRQPLDAAYQKYLTGVSTATKGLSPVGKFKNSQMHLIGIHGLLNQMPDFVVSGSTLKFLHEQGLDIYEIGTKQVLSHSDTDPLLKEAYDLVNKNSKDMIKDSILISFGVKPDGNWSDKEIESILNDTSVMSRRSVKQIQDELKELLKDSGYAVETDQKDYNDWKKYELQRIEDTQYKETQEKSLKRIDTDPVKYIEQHIKFQEAELKYYNELETPNESELQSKQETIEDIERLEKAKIAFEKSNKISPDESLRKLVDDIESGVQKLKPEEKAYLDLVYKRLNEVRDGNHSGGITLKDASEKFSGTPFLEIPNYVPMIRYKTYLTTKTYFDPNGEESNDAKIFHGIYSDFNMNTSFLEKRKPAVMSINTNIYDAVRKRIDDQIFYLNHIEQQTYLYDVFRTPFFNGDNATFNTYLSNHITGFLNMYFNRGIDSERAQMYKSPTGRAIAKVMNNYRAYVLGNPINSFKILSASVFSMAKLEGSSLTRLQDMKAAIGMMQNSYQQDAPEEKFLRENAPEVYSRGLATYDISTYENEIHDTKSGVLADFFPGKVKGVLGGLSQGIYNTEQGRLKVIGKELTNSESSFGPDAALMGIVWNHRIAARTAFFALYRNYCNSHDIPVDFDKPNQDAITFANESVRATQNTDNPIHKTGLQAGLIPGDTRWWGQFNSLNMLAFKSFAINERSTLMLANEKLSNAIHDKDWSEAAQQMKYFGYSFMSKFLFNLIKLQGMKITAMAAAYSLTTDDESRRESYERSIDSKSSLGITAFKTILDYFLFNEVMKWGVSFTAQKGYEAYKKSEDEALTEKDKKALEYTRDPVDASTVSGQIGDIIDNVSKGTQTVATDYKKYGLGDETSADAAKMAVFMYSLGVNNLPGSTNVADLIHEIDMQRKANEKAAKEAESKKNYNPLKSKKVNTLKSFKP